MYHLYSGKSATDGALYLHVHDSRSYCWSTLVGETTTFSTSRRLQTPVTRDGRGRTDELAVLRMDIHRALLPRTLDQPPSIDCREICSGNRRLE